MDVTMIAWGGLREWLFPMGEVLTVVAAAWAATWLWGR
jgi:hypothetical protein